MSYLGARHVVHIRTTEWASLYCTTIQKSKFEHELVANQLAVRAFFIVFSAIPGRLHRTVFYLRTTHSVNFDHSVFQGSHTHLKLLKQLHRKLKVCDDAA